MLLGNVKVRLNLNITTLLQKYKSLETGAYNIKLDSKTKTSLVLMVFIKCFLCLMFLVNFDILSFAILLRPQAGSA